MENFENQTNTEVSTKGEEEVRISGKTAEEFRVFKRQKKMAEITGSVMRSAAKIGGKDEVKRLIDRAVRFHQAAVKVLPRRLLEVKNELLKSRVKIDCVIGGDGETLPKVKVYEGKLAKKLGAKELTLILSPTDIFLSRYGEIKKEIRRIRRAAKGLALKVWVDKKYPFPMLARLARLVSEMGADYFCVPYFVGCERLRYDLFKGCRLEVSEVETLVDFKKMAGAGVERIVTQRVSEIYLEWVKEAEEALALEFEKEVKSAESTEEKAQTATTELKFV